MKELKILVAGLANAGKTSILRVLDKNVESISLLKPTQGVEYNKYKVLGFNVTAWDMGGQAAYRAKYLKEYENYFTNSLVLYYVIDVQEETAFKESLKYLKDIADIFTKLSMKDVYIVILLHKYDPHLHTPQMDTKLSSLKEKITKLLAQIPSVFFETSIYEPFMIYHAISDGILHHITGRELIHQKIKEFAEEYHSPATLLLSNKGYVYGAWHAKTVQVTELARFNRSVHNAAGLFMTEEEDSKLMGGSHQFNFTIMPFNYKDQVLLLSLMAPKDSDKQPSKEDLQKKRADFQKVLDILPE